MDPCIVDAMAAGLARLEQENRRLRRDLRRVKQVGIAALLGGFALVAVGADPGGPPRRLFAEQVVARQFVVRDDKGRERMILDTIESGAPKLSFHDPDGACRLELRVAPDGSAGMLGRTAGATTPLALFVGSDGSPQLSFADTDGQYRLGMTLGPGGTPRLTFHDRERARMTLKLTKEGAGALNMAE